MLLPSVAISCLVGVYQYAIVPDIYSCETSFYVLAKADPVNPNPDYADLNASQLITNDINYIAQSISLKEAIGNKMSGINIDDFEINVVSDVDSRVLKLVVSSPERDQLASFTNLYADILSDISTDVLGVDSISIIDRAVTPDFPSGPNRFFIITLSFIFTFIFTGIVTLFLHLINTRIGSLSMFSVVDSTEVLAKIPHF